MATKIISQEEAVELKRLYQEHVAAVNRAGVILVSKGAESPEFAEADRVAEAIHRRIRKILDTPDTGQPEGNEATAVTEPIERGTSGADPHREGQLRFPCVYIEARPKGRREGTPIDDYVVEDDADYVLGTFEKQNEAIEWARKNGHSPLVARVRHRNDKKRPDLWREA